MGQCQHMAVFGDLAKGHTGEKANMSLVRGDGLLDKDDARNQVFLFCDIHVGAQLVSRSPNDFFNVVKDIYVVARRIAPLRCSVTGEKFGSVLTTMPIRLIGSGCAARL